MANWRRQYPVEDVLLRHSSFLLAYSTRFHRDPAVYLHWQRSHHRYWNTRSWQWGLRWRRKHRNAVRWDVAVKSWNNWRLNASRDRMWYGACHWVWLTCLCGYLPHGIWLCESLQDQEFRLRCPSGWRPVYRALCQSTPRNQINLDKMAPKLECSPFSKKACRAPIGNLPTRNVATLSSTLCSIKSLMKILAARMGPTVCDEDGPTPIEKRSNVDTTAWCSSPWTGLVPSLVWRSEERSSSSWPWADDEYARRKALCGCRLATLVKTAGNILDLNASICWKCSEAEEKKEEEGGGKKRCFNLSFLGLPVFYFSLFFARRTANQRPLCFGTADPHIY